MIDTSRTVEVSLPISLPMGEVFGHRDWTDDKGIRHHKCWFCTRPWPRRKGDPYVKDGYPPMPPGCTLCACCGVLMYTGLEDPENEAMNVCHDCATEISADLAAQDAAKSHAEA